MYHDPFSRATKQPKIPDGKVTESLGFSTQAVKEIQCESGADGTMHMLLYGGQDAGLVLFGDQESGTRALANPLADFTVVGYTGSNSVDWSLVAVGGGNVQFLDDYTQWRLVSQGLKLSLLNPVEQEDGWWEAIRVTEPLDTNDWTLFWKDTGILNRALHGTVAPTKVLTNLTSRNLVNENSYATGLLKDLHKQVFKLHPRSDDHEIRHQMDSLQLVNADVLTNDVIDIIAEFQTGNTNVASLINMLIDPGFDYIYIRVHGRGGTTPSRFHTNIVSNQEITFSNQQRESRYQTRSSDIGASMDTHMAATRGNGSAAHRVPNI